MRLGAEEAEELVAAYIDGARIADLMQTFGLCRRAVHGYLDRSGCRRRPSGKGRLHSADERAMISDYLRGMTLIEVGAVHGVSKETVRRTLRDRGVARRVAARRTSA